MDAELTNRSRAAINAAGDRALKDGHPDLTPAHLLLALLEGEDNENITDLLAAVDADQAAVRADTERVLGALPSVTGSTVAPPQPNRELLAVIGRRARSGRRSWATSTSPPSTCSSASPPRAARPGRPSPGTGPPPRSC